MIQRFSITTTMSLAQVIDRLRAAGHDWTQEGPASELERVGINRLDVSASGTRFKVGTFQPVNHPIRPVVVGTIVPGDGGVRIIGVVRPSILGLLGLVGFLLALGVIGALLSRGVPRTLVALLVIMLLFALIGYAWGTSAQRVALVQWLERIARSG